MNKSSFTKIRGDYPLGILKPGMLLALIIFCPFASMPARADRPWAVTGRIRLDRDDVVVFTGGANTVAAQQNASLETLLTLAFVQRNARYRNLAWEGDTVFEQRREMNFGSWREQLKRVEATLIFSQFGQMESLQGKAALPKFIQAYEKLLDQLSNQTPRIVLISPMPFEKAKAPLPDLSLHNEDARLYVEAIRELARQRNYWFVDLFAPFRQPARKAPPLTHDGLQLTPDGHWAMAREITRQLGLGQVTKHIDADRADGMLKPDSAERLRQAIQAKNRLWFNYWRPMNWAFLHGDRIEQPSSRDYRDPKIRWFPAEMEKFMPLIEAKEKEIAGLAAAIPSGKVGDTK